jgi:keratan sulfate 6-sulfotransferase 1
MKIVRLRVQELSSLIIDDPSTKQWKIIYLFRDPRGVMSSRKNLPWCDPDPACNDGARLCAEVKDDVERINQLKKKFPHRVYLLKFEDLAASVEVETKKLFEFLGMPVTDSVKLFLSQHTQSNQTRDNPFSTIRLSNTVASEWKSKLSDQAIANITKVCAPTLKMLGFLEEPV